MPNCCVSPDAAFAVAAGMTHWCLGRSSTKHIFLCRLPNVDWSDRTHFFAVSAQVMRRVLVDHARARCAEKRGGGVLVTLCDDMGFSAVKAPDLLDLDNALSELEALDEM